MVSHKHKVIFMHISKCAGSSIESAFGIDIGDISGNNNENLFGWNFKNSLFLQHATPQELIDNGLIDLKTWNSYYKFIIIRNPYDRAVSDYFWLQKETGVRDSFFNFLEGKGKFEDVLTKKDSIKYRGDHLKKQIDYFSLNNQRIVYDRVLRFEELAIGLNQVIEDLSLDYDFFKRKVNVNKKKVSHYSKFYNSKRKQKVNVIYKEDLDYFNYSLEYKKTTFDLMNLLKNLLNR